MPSVRHQHPNSKYSFALPNARTIAFAIAIVRSKPPELSTGEYIRLLRQHIANGHRQSAVSATHRHLDRSSYWRSECERLKNALKRAEDQNISLQLEIESLKTKRENVRPATVTKKRKKVDEDAVPYPRHPKGSRRELSPTSNGPMSHAPSHEYLTSVDFCEAGETGVHAPLPLIQCPENLGNILLRSIFHVNEILKQRDKTQAPDLAYHVASAATEIPQIVRREVQNVISNQDPDQTLLKKAITIAGRAVKCLLMAFEKLVKMAECHDLQGKVIYAMVQMFKHLIDHLSVLSACETGRLSSAVPGAASSKKGPAAKSRLRATISKSAAIKENPMLSVYATFLVHLVDMIDPSVDANRPLFEGVSYCIIDKVGKRLFCTIFGHQRGHGQEEEILQSNKVVGRKDDEVGQSIEASNFDLEQAKLEAPYLVQLLHRTMIAAPDHLGLATSIKASKAKQVRGKGAVKGALAIEAKECLQRTLTNSIFGTEATDENDPFMDCLRMPIVKDDSLVMPKPKRTDILEWFKEEVWQLLGWDILERDFWK